LGHACQYMVAPVEKLCAKRVEVPSDPSDMGLGRATVMVVTR